MSGRRPPVQREALPIVPASLVVLGTKRRERADATRNRQRILSATERLVEERGADGVTMDAIACAARVGKGTLFRRFGDRAGLLREVLDERERLFQEAFIRGPSPLGPGAPAPQRLVAFGDSLLELIESRGDLLVAAETGIPGLRFRTAVYAVYRAHVTSLLRELPAVADPELLADILLGALSAELVLYQRRVRGMDVERLRTGWAALVDAVAGERATAPPSASAQR